LNFNAPLTLKKHLAYALKLTVLDWAYFFCFDPLYIVRCSCQVALCLSIHPRSHSLRCVRNTVMQLILQRLTLQIYGIYFSVVTVHIHKCAFSLVNWIWLLHEGNFQDSASPSFTVWLIKNGNNMHVYTLKNIFVRKGSHGFLKSNNWQIRSLKDILSYVYSQ